MTANSLLTVKDVCIYYGVYKHTAYYASVFDFKVVVVDIVKIDHDTFTSKPHHSVQLTVGMARPVVTCC